LGEKYRSCSLSLWCLLHPPVTSSLLGPKFSPVPYSQTPSAYGPLSMSAGDNAEGNFLPLSWFLKRIHRTPPGFKVMLNDTAAFVSKPV
jgi:hypothetical protein